MKLKRGFALPSVVVVMFIVVTMSTLMLTLVSIVHSNVEYNRVLFSRQNQIEKIKKDFIDNGTIDNLYDLKYEIFENSNDVNEILNNEKDIKAITISLKNSQDFLAVVVYNFDDNKMISNQNSNFYITIKNIQDKNYYFFADIIKFKEV